MTKAELIKKVAADADLTQKQAAAAVDSAINAVVNSVAAGEKVALIGFGTFEKKHRAAREGRNPATGKTMKFAASNTPVFKARTRSTSKQFPMSAEGQPFWLPFCCCPETCARLQVSAVARNRS